MQMVNKFYCFNVLSSLVFLDISAAKLGELHLSLQNTSKQLEQQVFFTNIHVTGNINIPKYLAFLLKTGSLYPDESVLYYSSNYHKPES